jgi:hypothetical protein
VAVLVLLAAFIGGGVSVGWSEGFQVAFGPPESFPAVLDSPAPAPAESSAPALVNVDYDRLDYERIANELSASVTSPYDAVLEDMRSELARVRVELERFDEFDAVEIQRLRAEIANLYNQNQLVQRGIYDQNAVVQEIASRLE